MKSIRFALVAVAAFAGTMPVLVQARQLTDADYARAAKFLLDSTDPLVGHFVDPRVDHEVRRVRWLDATHFWYRDHSAAGDRILEMNAVTGRVSPAFDAQKLAAALSKANGKHMDGNQWPAFGFDFHRL
ncbi:MAG: hypothetical protein GJU76_05980, partial [Gallionella sp.]|nr:hypothetical protein [Gallionella sp.]